MFLDIALGIFIAISVSWFFKTDLTIFLVLSAIIFALLPDVDALAVLIKKKKIPELSHEHRKILHYPILFILVFLIILLVNKYLGIIFLSASLWHFLNDTFGLGWGVQWFWPFSDKFLKGNLIPWKAPNIPVLPRKFLYIWSSAEQKKIAQKYHDPNWIKNHPKKYIITEIIIFLFAIICLIIYAK